jgi:hypothetical protein
MWNISIARNIRPNGIEIPIAILPPVVRPGTGTDVLLNDALVVVEVDVECAEAGGSAVVDGSPVMIGCPAKLIGIITPSSVEH